MMIERFFAGALLTCALVSTVHADDRQVTVGSGDTLWSIAKATRVSADVSIRDHAVAIYRANPQAFAADSMDSLVAGRILHIPDTGGVEHSSADASCSGGCQPTPRAASADVPQEHPGTVQIIRGSSIERASVRS